MTFFARPGRCSHCRRTRTVVAMRLDLPRTGTGLHVGAICVSCAITLVQAHDTARAPSSRTLATTDEGEE